MGTLDTLFQLAQPLGYAAALHGSGLSDYLIKNIIDDKARLDGYKIARNTRFHVCEISNRESGELSAGTGIVDGAQTTNTAESYIW